MNKFLRWVREKLWGKRHPYYVTTTSVQPHDPWAGVPWLERAILKVSPGLAASRALDRAAVAQIGTASRLSTYREGELTPRDDTPRARGASADWTLEMGFQRRDIVDMARQLERTNSIAGSVLDRAVEHIIGEGFRLKCRTGDKAWNKRVEELWKDWCLNGADCRGMMTFNEMISIAFRSYMRDGDCGLMLLSDGSIRVVESDEIASKIGGYYKPTDADGVELDRNGRIKSFYVFDYDPSILWPDRRTAIPRLIKVPAENMIFLARRLRAGQTRGISSFAGASWIFEILDDVLESVAVAHHMAAAAGWIVSKKTPMPGSNPGGGQLKMGPGKVIRLEPGEEITQLQPAHPSETFDMLIHTLTRVAAARFGMSLELVNYDFTAANYSNMRAQSQETAIACRIKQRGILTHACTQVFNWWIAHQIREGKVPARLDAGKHIWGVSGIAWQDPEVELRAAMGAVDGCLDTRRRILALHGLEFDEVIEELAEENKAIKKAGLEDIRSTITRDPTPDPVEKPKPGAKDRQRQTGARIGGKTSVARRAGARSLRSEKNRI